MIRDEQQRSQNQSIKNKFRRTGPLDAYIYQHRGDDQDVKEVQENVFIHLPEPVKNAAEIPVSNGTQFKTHIFTDGACTNNGKRNASAAWGLVVVADAGYNVLYTESGAIPKGEMQTNQRAELQGLLKGLRAAKKFYEIYPGLVTLWSDSQYAINCASVWGPKWKSNGWKKQGGPIQHFDLIRDLVEETMAMGHKVSYRWLKAHTAGQQQNQFPWMFNHQVDALATAALRP
jgi:ribonuclease HI